MLQYTCPFDTYSLSIHVIHVIHITIHASCYNTRVRSILILFQYTSYMLYILQYMLHVTIHVSVRYLFCFNTRHTCYTYYNTCFMLQYTCPFDTYSVSIHVIHVIHITIHASCYNTRVRSILILFQYTSYMLYILQYMLHVTIHVSVRYLFCFNTRYLFRFNTRHTCYTYYNTCFMLQYTCPFDTYSVSIHVIHVIHITIHASCYNTRVRSILILFQYTSYMLYILQYMLHVTIHVSVRYLFCFNTRHTCYTYYNTCFMLQYTCPFDTYSVSIHVIHVIHITIHASCYNTRVRSILILFQYTSYMLYILQYMLHVTIHVSVRYLFSFNTCYKYLSEKCAISHFTTSPIQIVISN